MADIPTEEKAFLASDKLKESQKKLTTLGIELAVDVNSIHALQGEALWKGAKIPVQAVVFRCLKGSFLPNLARAFEMLTQDQTGKSDAGKEILKQKITHLTLSLAQVDNQEGATNFTWSMTPTAHTSWVLTAGHNYNKWFDIHVDTVPSAIDMRKGLLYNGLDKAPGTHIETYKAEAEFKAGERLQKTTDSLKALGVAFNIDYDSIHALQGEGKWKGDTFPVQVIVFRALKGSFLQNLANGIAALPNKDVIKEKLAHLTLTFVQVEDKKGNSDYTYKMNGSPGAFTLEVGHNYNSWFDIHYDTIPSNTDFKNQVLKAL